MYRPTYRQEEDNTNSPPPITNDVISPQNSANENQIKLHIGGKEFLISRSTAQQSKHLAELPRNRQECWIDGDPRLFEHLLRYMRRGVYPLFFTKEKGHDYAMYVSILGESRFYKIDRLSRWIEAKHYKKAVQLKNTTTLYGPITPSANGSAIKVIDECIAADAEIQQTDSWTFSKRFTCPDNPRKACHSCLINSVRMHSEVETNCFNQLCIVQVTKEIVFDEGFCLE